VTDSGKVQGRFRCTNSSPKVLERLRMNGVELDRSVFDESVDVNLEPDLTARK
jgi:hypothetical protein